ncbi:hypothetical protein WA588_001083 [Blastocystis sp. NMH]
MSQPGKHTILFVQREGPQTRTYYDFPTVTQCMAFIIDMFQRELIRVNPTIKKLSYQVSDIYRYIDALPEFNMLILDPDTHMYAPYGKAMIKEKVLMHLNHISRNSN